MILCFYTSVTLPSYSSNRDIVLNQANNIYKTLLGTSNSASGKCVCLICKCTLCISHQNKTACHLPSTTQFVFVYDQQKKEAKASLLILTQILILLYLLLDQTDYYYISIRFVALT